MAVDNLFPRPTNVTDPAAFFLEYPNTLTDGLVGIGLLLVVYVIVFGSLVRFGTRRALAASSFVGLLVSITLSALGIVGGEAFTLSVVIVIAAIILAGGDGR